MVWLSHAYTKEVQVAISIQVDDEVEQTLAKRAAEEGLALFSPGTPNLVLRIALGLDQSRYSGTTSPELDRPTLRTTAKNAVHGPRAQGRTHQRIGPRLLREHGLNCAKGYFSKTGIPYQKPDSFPAALFDTNGFFIVDDEEAMRDNPYINVGKQISIPAGVYSVPGYIKCPHEHS